MFLPPSVPSPLYEGGQRPFLESRGGTQSPTLILGKIEVLAVSPSGRTLGLWFSETPESLGSGGPDRRDRDGASDTGGLRESLGKDTDRERRRTEGG